MNLIEVGSRRKRRRRIQRVYSGGVCVCVCVVGKFIYEPVEVDVVG